MNEIPPEAAALDAQEEAATVDAEEEDAIDQEATHEDVEHPTKINLTDKQRYGVYFAL